MMQHFNTSSSNSTSMSPEKLAPSVVLGLCCLVGIPSNIAVVTAIARHVKRKDFTLKLMLNLAVSDLLSLITLPLWIYSWHHGWVLDLMACKLFSYLVYCSLCISLLTVTLMSIQRYLAVLSPQYWVKLHETGERVLLVALWIGAGVLASPAIVVRDVVVRKEDGQHRCIRNYQSGGQEVAVLLMETILGFFFSFSILAVSYFCLHKRVKRSAFFSSHRMSKLVTSIVLTFFIFWFPLHSINVLDIFAVFLKLKSLQNFCKGAWMNAAALTFINSCVNPFLYACASRKLKRATAKAHEMYLQKDG